jgi:subtilisin
MSAQIDQELKATGVAQVIVVLKSHLPVPATAAGKPTVKLAAAMQPLDQTEACRELKCHFAPSDMSQNFALASAGLGQQAALAGTTAKALRKQPPARPPFKYYPNLGVMFGTVTLQGLASLRADPRVESITGAPFISLIKPVKIQAADAPEDATWGIKNLGIEPLWKKGLTGKGIKIGHLDTGVDGTHETLQTAIAAFVEMDSLGEPLPGRAPHDTDDHGTHTAGTIAGRGIGNRRIGVAPQGQLCSAIVIEGGNVVGRVLGGLDWAVQQNVKLISMSLGFRGWWEDFIPIVRILRERNILPVIAVGNEGPGTSRSPGNYPEVLSVGAHDERRAVASFSSSQRFQRAKEPRVPDLVSPGVNVVSAKPGGGYQMMSGSSMATPHIAGLAALLFEAVPTASANQVEEAIFGSCTLDPPMTPDRANRGFPNAPKALAKLTGLSAPKRPKKPKSAGPRKRPKAPKKKSRRRSSGRK